MIIINHDNPVKYHALPRAVDSVTWFVT